MQSPEDVREYVCAVVRYLCVTIAFESFLDFFFLKKSKTSDSNAHQY